MTQSNLILLAKLEIEKQKYEVLVNSACKLGYSFNSDAVEDAIEYAKSEMLEDNNISEKDDYAEIESEVSEMVNDAVNEVASDIKHIAENLSD